MAHRPPARKRFGQHFLTDGGVIDGIVSAIHPVAGQVMVEIGPGWAALTQPLVERLGRLHVVEIDRDLARELRQHAHLDVMEADVLRVDFTALAQRLDVPQLRVVGNLPYNISTPVLFHLLEHVQVIEDQHFMLQKEVVDRMVAAADTAQYSRLSVVLQARYAMQLVLDVAPAAFDPPPKVDSAVVRMLPRPASDVVNLGMLSELARVAFGQRRKLMRHTLGPWLQQAEVDSNFDLSRRAQEVPVQEYVDLARLCIQHHEKKAQ